MIDPDGALRNHCFDRWALLFLLLAALALRLAVGFWFQSRLEGRFAFGDSESYWVLGQSVAQGGPYQWGPGGEKVFRTPGYPVLLAPIFLVFGEDASPMWGRALSAVLGMAAVAAVWLLARQLFDRRAALVAAAMAAFYPEAIALGALVLSEAPFSVLVPLNLSAWVAAWRAERTSRAVVWSLGCGLIAAAAALMRPSWLLFIPFAAGIGVLAGPRRGRQAMLAGAMLVGLALGMAPWWIRNARVVGHLVPTTLQVGASLYDGLNPAADGSSNLDFMAKFTRQQRQRYARLIAERPDEFEYLLDRRIREAAVDWACQHPGRVIELAGIKFLRMWNLWPNERALAGLPVRLAVAVSYLPILVLGLVGAWKTFGRGWPYVLCWLPAAYLTLLHVIFVSSIRYRGPAMLAIIVLAAGAVEAGIEKWELRTGKQGPRFGR